MEGRIKLSLTQQQTQQPSFRLSNIIATTIMFVSRMFMTFLLLIGSSIFLIIFFCNFYYFACDKAAYLILISLFYLMSRSVASRASNASSKMLQELANRSQTKIHRIEGSMNDEEMRVIWNALGLYISRNLRMGRGVNIPRLGIFTFTPPEVRLKGVTNEGQRDQQPRTPVFLIQKQFLKGVNLRTAIFYHQDFGSGLRPYSAMGATGQIPIAKMNLIEVASYANMSKDATELGIARIIKYIGQKLLNGESVNLELPNLGQLICRNHLVAVKFNEYVLRDTRNVLSKSVDMRKQRGVMSLTSDNLKRLNNQSIMSSSLGGKGQEFFDIDNKARQYLSTTFNIQMDNNNFKRSMTNFDRTVASKMFDSGNKSLKDSHGFRMSQSGFFGQGQGPSSKQFNMALRIVREWVRDKGLNSKQGYSSFCALSGKKSQALDYNDVWAACREISIDITQQMCLQLFRILDSNRDGMVTWDDWQRNMHFNHHNTKLKDLVTFVRGKKYGVGKVINLMGLEGVRKVSVFSLKEGIMKLWSQCGEEDALLLSKFIAQGKDEVEVERIIDALNVHQNHQVEVDSQWQNKFMSRLKRKLIENHTSQQQLLCKFKLYDVSSCGFIEQTDFKTVLGELGISLNLTELIKLVKFVPINNKNQLRYQFVVDKLVESVWEEKELLTEEGFRKVMRTMLAGKTPFPVPIAVVKLTSWLQSKHFKHCQERQVLSFVRGIDVNQDQLIDSEDLRRYCELISDKSFRPMAPVEIEQLLIRLRERRIKKKISFYDLFRKLDKVGSGFITREGWFNNISQILPLSEDEKNSLFNYMDKSKTSMVDYKTFLAVMNSNGTALQSQKFDWVEKTLEGIKKWFRESRLTAEDCFNLIDKDGDTYLGEKDLHAFLVEKLKYQERELGMVRVQKLMKVMDCYKHGRITFIDWIKIINETKDWIADAKQQIGIVLSKHYQGLSDAFYQISTGDKKLLFGAFEKWIRDGHVLSGFMINQDMLRFLFNSLDQHKKGYIFESDFIGLFGSYSWKSQHCREVTDFLKIKFGSADEAFRCISAGNKNINFSRFSQALNQFFKGRFQPSDAKNIWKTISGGKDTVDQSHFIKLHSSLWPSSSNQVDSQFPKDSWQYQDFSIIKGTTVRSNEFGYEQRQKMEDQCNKFIDNLRDILASSPKTLEQVFSEIDKEKSGRITNLMFKKAFRSLNIALTSKQIDLLLNFCQFKSETLIDWKKFIKVLDLHEDKQKIRNRIQPKLQHISNLMHYYMISPKDAFRKWNNPRTGYFRFQEFQTMLKELFRQANEELPHFQHLQDLFKFVDVRKDGQIDFQEWTQMFRTCEPPSLLMGTTPAPSDKILSKPVVDKEANWSVKQKSIPKFRHSPEYQKFVNLIGRNRRYLQVQIEKCNAEKAAFIDFKQVERVISGFAAQHKLVVDGGMVRNLIAFAMTGQKVDYHLLVGKFKDLSLEIVEFPKTNVF